MKKLFLSVVLLIFIFASFVCATTWESITVSDTAIGFSAALYLTGNNKAQTVMIQLDGGDSIRWKCDGGTPTASAGNLLSLGDKMIIYGEDNIKNFKAIRTGSTDGELNCTYYFANEWK